LNEYGITVERGVASRINSILNFTIVFNIASIPAPLAVALHFYVGMARQITAGRKRTRGSPSWQHMAEPDRRRHMAEYLRG